MLIAAILFQNFPKEKCYTNVVQIFALKVLTVFQNNKVSKFCFAKFSNDTDHNKTATTSTNYELAHAKCLI